MIEALWIFLAGAVAIAVAGSRLARTADELADRSGLGEAVTGALLLGGMTSLPGLIASVIAAWNGLPEMAVSNAVGGIAAQTFFLVLADFAHRRANLEHAAASHTNLFQGTLLVMMLALPLLAANVPAFAGLRVHPVSFLMIALYVWGLGVAARVREEKMWRPRRTEETRTDEPEETESDKSLRGLVTRFAFFGGVTAAAGWLVARAGVNFVVELGWRESLVGGLLTAVASSLPELVTTVAAVRRGAFTLAVSGIVGGNAFDTLFVAGADMAYREGSIFHAMSGRQEFLLAMAILMTAILLGGLVRRERKGFANVGSEGLLILGCYAIAVWAMAV